MPSSAGLTRRLYSDFIVHIAHWLKRMEGSVKTKLMAVRYHHLLEGLNDPLKGKGRIWLVPLAGLNRKQVKAQRKLPVDVDMLN